MSGGVVCVTLLLGAERWPLKSTVTTVYVVVRLNQSFESESVQYHQLAEPPFAASQASEMLVSELAVIRRFVGAPDPPPSVGGGGGGLFAGAAETATRARAKTSAAKTTRRDIGAPPNRPLTGHSELRASGGNGFAAAAAG